VFWFWILDLGVWGAGFWRWDCLGWNWMEDWEDWMEDWVELEDLGCWAGGFGLFEDCSKGLGGFACGACRERRQQGGERKMASARQHVCRKASSVGQ
jgi:hypothetical protein